VLVRVRLVGSGSADDPYRVPLPTWTHVASNTGATTSSVPVQLRPGSRPVMLPLSAHTAIVDVPADDLQPGVTTPLQVQGQPVVAQLDADTQASLLSVLRVRYGPAVTLEGIQVV
jgi:hypothetical protein